MRARLQAWFWVAVGAMLGACSGKTEAPTPAPDAGEPPAHCSNLRHDSNESGVDCGGFDCRRCHSGEGCVRASDCENGQCFEGACRDLVCANLRRDPPETDIDCGGLRCPACAPGAHCLKGSDCASGVCAGEACAAPSCDDGVKNAAELAVDCGSAPCPGCPAGTACSEPSQCASALCEAGACAPACAEGSAECDGDLTLECETDTRRDPAHCGDCQTLCALDHAVASCVEAVCAIGACVVPYADCNAEPKDGCETNLASDAEHCGACDGVCSRVHATPACTEGSCALTCDPGYDDCDRDASNGCETSTASDVQHCGGCNRICRVLPAETAICVDGACGTQG